MEHVYYAELLTRASQAPTTLEELPYLAAFVLSAYPHTIYRMAKPFNPLLGETFECDRRAEAGWRSFMEQVQMYLYMYVYVHVCYIWSEIHVGTTCMCMHHTMYVVISIFVNTCNNVITPYSVQYWLLGRTNSIFYAYMCMLLEFFSKWTPNSFHLHVYKNYM